MRRDQGQSNSNSITIRRAVPDDAVQIASMLYQSFAEFKSLYTEGGFAATVLTREPVIVRISEGPVWIALADGTVVGTVSIIVKGDALYVRGMAVLPQARGQRIGELLLRQIEMFARANHYWRLFLSTTPFLHRAIGLYKHFGFRRTEEGPHDLFGTPLFTMEKTLISSE